MPIKHKPNASFRRFLIDTIAAQIHLFSAGLMILATVHLLPLASARGPEHFWACLIFGLTGTAVFLSSGVYHLLDDGFELAPWLTSTLDSIDHFSISLFIAGTVTPTLINTVEPPWRSRLMIVIWATALGGILYRSIRPYLPAWAKHRFLSTALYVLMGWVVIFRIQEIAAHVSASGLWLLLGGAVAYTVGAVVYATEKPSFFKGYFGYHELWHCFVTLGAALHYFFVYNFYRV